MKILISGQDSGGWGGAEIFVYSLTKEFKKRGISVYFTTTKNSPFTLFLQKKNEKVYQVPARMDLIGGWKGFVKFFLFLPFLVIVNLILLKQFKKEGGSIVVLTSFSDKIVLSPLSRLLGLAVVWIEFGPLAPLFAKNLNLPSYFYRLFKNIPKAIITPSYFSEKSLLKDAKVNIDRIIIIPCGIKIIKKDKL